ncbi:MAG TPA: cytochrome c biogenesis protein ResB [bacterium]|nr:cytochrome c biogenesis protein ResB [bacterium]
MDPIRRVVDWWASPKLTVWLLALLMFLIFAGTWAQIDMGIWATLKIYFRSLFVWIPFQIFLPRAWDVPGALPFPGGSLLGAALFINLIAAHTVRFRLTRKRLGLLLIHFALILLFIGEFVTAMFANEANMSIDEGQTISYAEDVRTVELAVIDRSDPDEDHVVVVPERLLAREKKLSDPLLPFDLEVTHYYPNSQLVNRSEAPNAPGADQGVAANFGLTAVRRPVASGVGDDSMDLPVAFVRASADGNELGTWMVPLYLSLIESPDVQTVAVGGRTYEMWLRYQREYKPYSIHLLDFAHDRYLGTDTPRNYSSHIRLIDPERGEDREVLIYMNNPLRYRGETFYQASFKKGDLGTVLQVVRNPGWLIPYIACTIGAIGLCIQFGASLGRFLSKRRTA